MAAEERCACGLALHYASPESRAAVERQVAELGPDVPMATPYGSWLVPRHYIALHGIKAENVPVFAVLYGWARA